MAESDLKQTQIRSRERRSNIIVLGLLVAFFILIFWRVIFLREVMIGGDAFYYSFPLRSQAWQIIRQGSLPLWTTSLFGGYPLLAMSQLALGYPITWGYLFLPSHWAEQIYVAAPFLLASIFTFIYLRQIGRSAVASMLAALSFSYSGFFIPSVNGVSTNGAIWLPVMLLAIERSRTHKLTSCLLLSTAAFAMAVLNGYGQVFLYVGILSLIYSATMALSQNRVLPFRQRFRPIAVVIGGITLATGLTAFQTLETWQAISLSIRQSLDYETFVEGSFGVQSAWKSFIAPRFNMVDVTTYVPMLAALLAFLGVTQTRKDFRVGFWLIVSVAAFVLMLGGNSPLYPLIYKIPLVNLFRVPARHAFEWTFAISVLAAFGWDTLAVWTSERRGSSTALRITTGSLLMLAIAIGCYWTSVSSETNYVIVKLSFTCVIVVAVWLTLRQSSNYARAVLGGCLVVVACFFEASILFRHLWYPNRQPGASQAFISPAPATKVLQQFPATDGRVYTDGPHVANHFDSFNLVPTFGLSNVAGYEPAMLTRFSRAMGNVGIDTSQLRHGFSSDGSIFEPRSHVLDILNTKYTTAFWDLGDSSDQTIDRDGVHLIPTAAPIRLKPRESAVFTSDSTQIDSVVVVSSLAYAGGVPQGERIARIRLHDSTGSAIERELRAGIDTAEWAHERPDIRATIPHQLPPIFDSVPGDDINSFLANRYLTKIGLGDSKPVTKIEFENVSGVQLLIWKLSLFNSETKVSQPIPLLGPERWEPLFNKNRVVVLKNKRALPRVWVVSRVRSVRPEEALDAIRGRSELDFDPVVTALVETPEAELPKLNGGSLSNSSAQIVAYQPNQLMIDVNAEAPLLLVVSEIHYPGWVAEVDAQPTEIQQTNYLIRGVFVPVGKHRVTMRYTAPAARLGLAISGLSGLILCGIVFYSRRRWKWDF